MLPQKQPIELMQTSWAEQLNPVISNPLMSGQILKLVTLQIGSNAINHKLGRALQGWYIVRQRAAANIYDTQDSNTRPNLTLLLTSDAVVTADLFVF